MSNAGHSASKPAAQFWILSIFLCLVFVTGGASRVDVQSLIILRPVSVLVCAFACVSLRPANLAGRSWVLWGFAIAGVLALLHVVPLPPAIWQSFPGREDLIQVDALAGLGSVWRPLTLTPANGWHAILSLTTPLAIILLAMTLNRQDLSRLLPLTIALAVLSGFVGLLQVISDPEGPLYFYRITNNGSAVGLFANRNHAATLLALLFPMLSVYASTASGTDDQIKSRGLFAAAVAIVLIPLVLVTGSRSGLLSALIGVIAVALLYRRPVEGHKVRRGDKKRRIGPVPVLTALAVLSIGFLTVFFSRAVAIDRLFAETAEVSRADYWAVSLDLFWKYFPWGSGSGSFVEAFLIAEPNNILNATYVNRAHNDLLETALTFGAPGLLLVAMGVVFLAYRSYVVWRFMDGSRSSVLLARAASVMILILGIASLSDYPLRTPTMMGVLSICLLWLAEPGRSSANSAIVARQEI